MIYLLIGQMDLITCTDSTSNYSQLNFNRELSSPSLLRDTNLCACKGCQRIMRNLYIYFANKRRKRL